MYFVKINFIIDRYQIFTFEINNYKMVKTHNTTKHFFVYCVFGLFK